MDELDSMMNKLWNYVREIERLSGDAVVSTRRETLEKARGLDELVKLENTLWNYALRVDALQDTFWNGYQDLLEEETYQDDKEGLNSVLKEMADLAHRVRLASRSICEARKKVEDQIIKIAKSATASK